MVKKYIIDLNRDLLDMMKLFKILLYLSGNLEIKKEKLIENIIII
jgi:hypothetical protein